MKHIFSYHRDIFDQRDYKFSETIFPHRETVLPRLVDLRSACPPVYDQGKLGSCTANAGCTCRAMLVQGNAIEFSRMFLYYAERALEGKQNKDAGASLRDTCKSIYRYGICEEAYMPYNAEKFKSAPDKTAVRNARNYKITAYKSLNSLEEIKQNLAFRQQPVLLGMDVYESLETGDASKTGNMTMPAHDEKKLGSHAVLAVGYSDPLKHRSKHGKYRLEPGYLIVRNSWGEPWGDRGYFYMPYDYVTPEFTFDYWIME